MIVALLFYSDEKAFAALGREARNQLVERHIAFNHEVVQPRSLLMMNRALQPSSSGRLVWPEGDEPRDLGQTQGGLALSGLYLLDCADLDEAEGIARDYPMPPGLGCLEVRPAMEAWDYAPSIDLDATRLEDVWAWHANISAWSQWLPWVDEVIGADAPFRGDGGSLSILGRPAMYVFERVEPPTDVVVTISFPAADEQLLVELIASAQPRGATRVIHRAHVPRGLLDFVGTSFSADLNAAMRAGLRDLGRTLTGVRE